MVKGAGGTELGGMSEVALAPVRGTLLRLWRTQVPVVGMRAHACAAARRCVGRIKPSLHQKEAGAKAASMQPKL